MMPKLLQKYKKNDKAYKNASDNLGCLIVF